MKKSLCMVLAILMLTSVFFSCASRTETPASGEADGTKNDNSDKTVTEDTEPDVSDDGFVVKDFDGAEFKFLHYGSAAPDFADEYIWSDGMGSGSIGDAVFYRNRLVEEKYDVTVTAEECSPMGEAVKRMQAGQCDFEVIYEWGIRSKSAALDGYLYNFWDLPYVSLHESYWIKGAAKGLTVADKLYITTNYISMNGVSWADCLLINKTMFDELGYEDPYDYVYADNWTYDMLIPMVLGADKDLNDDGEVTYADQWGIFDGLDLRDVCSAPLVSENDDGTYNLIGYTETMVANYTKYCDSFAQVTDIGYDELLQSGVDTATFPSKHIGARFLTFGEGHCLFMNGFVNMMQEFSSMEDNYGLLPTPVANIGDDFSSSIDYCAPMFSIPEQVEDPEMVGAILEYMAYESEKCLYPAYVETIMKNKKFEDARDYEMLDIIVNSIDYSWEDLYLWDSEAASMRRNMLASGTFVPVWEKYSEIAQAEIDEMVDTLKNIK